VAPLSLVLLQENGSGPLHFAASYGLHELCLDLVGLFGFPAYAANARGRTPAAFAREAGFAALAELLEDAAGLQLQHDAL